jgi:hypothetical protein
VLRLLRAIGDATDGIAVATTDLLATARTTLDARRLGAVTARGRGLLAHATGRLAIYKIGHSDGSG